MFNNSPSPRKPCRWWDNVGKCGRQATGDSIVQRMRFPFWITQATDTDSENVIFIAFPLQQWLHERSLILLYMYIACVVKTLFLKIQIFLYSRWCIMSYFVRLNVIRSPRSVIVLCPTGDVIRYDGLYILQRASVSDTALIARRRRNVHTFTCKKLSWLFVTPLPVITKNSTCCKIDTVHPSLNFIPFILWLSRWSFLSRMPLSAICLFVEGGY